MSSPAALVSSLPLLAQGADAAAPGDQWQTIRFVVTVGGIFVIFWFLILRPQRQQDKARRAMLEALKKRDRVLTSGGLLGVVQDLRDDEVTLRISDNPDVKVRVRRSAVVEILVEPTTATP